MKYLKTYEKSLELKDLYKKLNNLLDLQERRDLTKKEQEELDKLKKLRNKLDPNWHKQNEGRSPGEYDENGNHHNSPKYHGLKVETPNTYHDYEMEDFTMSDMEDVKDFWKEGFRDPEEIAREMDYKNMDVETVTQIIDTLKNKS